MSMARFPTVLMPTALDNESRDRASLQSLLSQTVQPIAAHYRPPKGHSETQFEHELWRYFPGKIHTEMIMPQSENQALKSASPYTPDFVYIEPKLNLHIDIEVDEPYTYDTRQPLHYIDCPKDQIRNQCFLAWGWAVIRFSEAQVVKFPESCCKTIASVIAKITGDSSIMVSFRQVSTLKPADHWTLAEAEQMAAANYRATYLTASTPTKLNKRKRKPQHFKRASVITANFTFYCPECGEGPIRWRGHYISCPNCQYDAFAL